MTDLVKLQPATIPYQEVEKMATVIANSGLFGVKNPVQALALMLVAASEGLHPATAARDYHVIQGRPALKSDAMLARFQAAGGSVEWRVYTEQEVTGVFSHPYSPAKVPVTWTIAMAHNIEQEIWKDGENGKRFKVKQRLTDKDVWKQYPRAMLRARVISEGIRTVYPAVLCGMYAPEEVRDMVDVEGTAEVAPDYPQQATPPEPQYDFEAAEATINGFDDDALLAQWLAQERIKNGWKKADHPHYVAVKAVCAERAAVIREARKAAEQAKAAEDTQVD